MNAEAPRRLLALLDDGALARSVIEMSSAVAHQLQRPLELVYVESAPALLAAALPFAQVLAHGGLQWTPLAPQDVERGYLVQAARLRALAERIALRRSVDWSMRVVRGALSQVALELRTESDLILVASTPVASAPAAPSPMAPRRSAAGRRPVIAVVTDRSAAGQQAQRLAEQLAHALSGVLLVRQAAADGRSVVAGIGRCDLLVLPQALVRAGEVAALAQPTLLVGAA
jgi:hypothetical protein